MELIDTHLHLIWRDRFGYGWTEGIPVLAEGDFTPEAYQARVKDQGITGAIVMECGVDEADYQAEARYVATRVGGDGILGQIASCRPETEAGFDAWLEECGGLDVKGFRRILHVVPDEMSQGASFRANLRKIGQQGLPFDMCFLARQLPIAEALARACDAQQLVLDHCGVPDIAGGLSTAGQRVSSASPPCRMSASSCRASLPIAPPERQAWNCCGLGSIM